MSDVGDVLPDLGFETTEGKPAKLSDYRGKPLVVYFYPKDDTSGCTTEAKAFSDLMPEFAALGVAVVGVSKDSVASHQKFIKKYELKVPLVSDVDGSLCEGLGVWVEKSMYGKKYMGIERATFLVGSDGRIAQVWRKVKVPGHAESVLTAARAMIA